MAASKTTEHKVSKKYIKSFTDTYSSEQRLPPPGVATCAVPGHSGRLCTLAYARPDYLIMTVQPEPC